MPALRAAFDVALTRQPAYQPAHKDNVRTYVRTTHVRTNVVRSDAFETGWPKLKLMPQPKRCGAAH